MLAPAGIAIEIVAILNAGIGQVVNTPEMKVALNKQGLDPRISTPEQFAASIHSEIEQNRTLIQRAGVKPE